MRKEDAMGGAAAINSVISTDRKRSFRSLVRRATMIFFRTKGNVFFSFLSVGILLVLHFVIFRDMYTDSWAEMVSHFPGAVVGRDKLVWLVDSLMFSALIPIGAVTVSLVVLGLMVSDKENAAINDFMVAPISRKSLLASYICSSFLIGFMVLLCFIGFFEVFSLTVHGVGFSFVQLLLVLLVTGGSLVFANVFMLLLLSFFKSQSNLAGAGTIIGTGIGFITGAYIPIGMFGPVFGDIASALPFLQLTVLSRQAFLHNLETSTPLTSEMLSGEIGREMGIELWFNGVYIPLWGIILLSAGVTLALLACLVIRFARLKHQN